MLIKLLKNELNKKHITQQDLIKKTNISQSKLSLIFNNKRKLTADELIIIAIAFKINLNKIKKEIKTVAKQILDFKR